MKSLLLVALIVSQSALAALECPAKIRVQLTESSAIAASDATVNAIFKQGDEQTDKEYIKEILRIAGTLRPVDEVLKYSQKESYPNYRCTYLGKSGRLSVVPVDGNYSGKYNATFTTGKINYTSTSGGNPSEHKGFAVDISSDVTKFDKTQIKTKSDAAALTLDLLIQIPLGDYGTDGFTELAKIGKAKIKYQVVQ